MAEKRFPVQAVFVYFALLLLFLMMPHLLGGKKWFVVRLVISHALFLVPLFFFRTIIHSSGAVITPAIQRREYFRLKNPGWKSLFLVGLLAVAAAPSVLFIGDFIAKLLPGYLKYQAEMHKLVSGKTIGLVGWQLVILFAFLPAICEEVFFRGYLLSAFDRASGKSGFSIVLTSLLFALFHLDPYRFFPVAVLGALMGLVTVVSGSVFSGMVFHLINNLLAVLGIIFTAEDPPVRKITFSPELIQLLFVFLSIFATVVLLQKFIVLHKKEGSSPQSQ